MLMDSVPSVVLFGDSLTQYSFSSEAGWGSLIADTLQRKCDVLSRGFSGYNSAWCKLILPYLIKKQDADNIAAFTIFLGANDSANQELNPRQHVPLVDYEDNLVQMIQCLENIGLSKDKIILIGPPPVDTTKWAKNCEMKGKPQSLCNEVRGKYAEACKNAAVRMGVDHVELYDTMMERKEWTDYLNDGLHFSTEGANFLFNQLWPILDKKTEHLPIRLPFWDAVDYKNPENSFKF